MKTEVIQSNLICEYCVRKFDYYNGREFLGTCPLWFRGELCKVEEDFVGKELIEVEE